MKTALKKSKSTPVLATNPPLPVDLPVPVLPQAQEARRRTSMPPPAEGASALNAPMAALDLQSEECGDPVIESQIIPGHITSEQLVSQYRATRQQLWEQRARQMLEKYDLVVESELKPLGQAVEPTAIVERIKKPIRMRVHRYCHRCETVFGPERICASCEHRRCKKCPRFPRERSVDRDGSRTREPRKNKAKREEQHAASREPLLVIQNPRTGGQILVHNRIVQRVHRNCHKCRTEFMPPSSRTCSECGHARCARCSTTSGKMDKWRQGFAEHVEGSSEEEQQQPLRHLRQERVFRKPRQRVRWNCDQCNTLFLEGQRTCRQCGHEKCENCGRHP